MWNRIFQTLPDFLFSERISDPPHAQFPALETRLKVGHAGIDKIFFRFMEKEEMGPPGNVTNNTDSGRSQLFVYHSHLQTMLNLIEILCNPYAAKGSEPRGDRMLNREDWLPLARKLD
jgi:hypothetical protein